MDISLLIPPIFVGAGLSAMYIIVKKDGMKPSFFTDKALFNFFRIQELSEALHYQQADFSSILRQQIGIS